jgi:monovalent cation:H+ antiporter-2, CPA2 family
VEDLGLVGTLAVVAAAAFVGGIVARLLRLPTVLGYLAAGLVISPNTPGFVGDIDEVQTVADLGVALLMFTLGIRFSLREMLRVGPVAIGGGLFQVVAMIAAGIIAAAALGLDASQGFVIGAVVAMSSTVVAMRLLESRGEIGRTPGTMSISFSLVQDLAAIPLIVMIPVVAGDADDFFLDLGLAAGTAVLLIAGVWIVGTIIVPRIFGRVLVMRSRELFLLTVVALALGTASISFLAGLSLAFGAFLAGLLVSESEYAHQTLAEVFPLREVFAVVFFVAIGMLIDPASFVDHPEIVLGVAAVGIFGKVILIAAIMLAFGFPLRTALMGGMALGTMAEFSFVLATEGMREGVWDPGINEAVLAAVLLSIALSPAIFPLHEPLANVIGRAPFVKRMVEGRTQVHIPDPGNLVNHTVICGYDEAGQELGRALATRGFRYVVIDENPVAIRRLREAGVPCILGDPSLGTVLEQADVERARVLAVTTPDVSQAERIVTLARQMNPRLDIVARAEAEEAHLRLRQVGVSRVVGAEFEVGMEFVHHTLHRFGIPSQEVQALLARRRRDYGQT